jgi:uncharacterized protein YhbP (UPF0306 family)
MPEERPPAEIAKEIVDASLYMVIGTADRTGQPWATPVFYSHAGYREYFWVSEAESQHSRNLRDRREVGGVIFDSTAKIGNGQGVYVLGVAQELPAHECADPIKLFSKRSRGHDGERWTLKDVTGDSPHRLYRATAEALYVLDEHDHRIEVRLQEV